MSNQLKFCSCRTCRRGLHHGRGGDCIAKKATRQFRHQTKDALRKGKEPPQSISVPYTW